jgi:hypothetical protein
VAPEFLSSQHFRAQKYMRKLALRSNYQTVHGEIDLENAVYIHAHFGHEKITCHAFATGATATEHLSCSPTQQTR